MTDNTPRAVRDLVRGLDRAALATNLPVEDRTWPYASLVLVAADHDLSPILLLSDLAEHSKAIAADGRVHARVTVAREMSAADQQTIAAQLSRALGKTVVPHIAVDGAILGGVVVRIGDTVMDGSVRRRLAVLRRRMLGTA